MPPKGSYIGIDFSGDAARWGVGTRRRTVWVAALAAEACPRVLSLDAVQDLANAQAPFEWLARWLAGGGFLGVGIDAPFSVPREAVPEGRWSTLVKRIDDLSLDDRRPFPRANSFLGALCVSPSKALRATEVVWRTMGVNTRSTLWWKPRGGAPFAAACLKLIATAGMPCWPWSPLRKGFLCEAFPAAQLKQWNLSRQGYNGSDQQALAIRSEMVDQLKKRLDFGRFEARARGCADALDAVLAAFAPIAVATGALARTWSEEDAPLVSAEGWIAVHE